MLWPVLLTIMTMQPTTAPSPAKLLLVIDSRGFVHDVVKRDNGPSRVERTFEQLSKETGGFDVEVITDVKDFTPRRLAGAKLVVFYTTGDLPMTDEQFDAFEKWIRAGGGFLGIHCATDTLANHPRYPALIGGTFDGHPWEQDAIVTIKVHDPGFAACKPFGESCTFQEEIYQIKNFDPTKVRVLISLDMQKTELKKPLHVPIAWCKSLGQGKVFYTSLGHRDDVWTNPKFQAHLLGAIRWLLGSDRADATPNPQVSEHEGMLARRAAAAEPAR